MYPDQTLPADVLLYQKTNQQIMNESSYSNTHKCYNKTQDKKCFVAESPLAIKITFDTKKRKLSLSCSLVS